MNSMPPSELVDARLAYQSAGTGQAEQLIPAELHKAQIALEIAEKAFTDEPDSYHTRDVADRKAKIAEAMATTSVENAATAKGKKGIRINSGPDYEENSRPTCYRTKSKG